MNQQALPLRAPRLRSLSHVADPPSSVRAAATVLRDGTEKLDAQLLLTLIRNHPGETMEQLGARAAALHGGDAYRWRLKLGRRTGPLKREGLIHPKDGEDGMALWFPGDAALEEIFR